MSLLTPTTELRERAKRLQERIARDPDHSELAQIALKHVERDIECADFLDHWCDQVRANKRAAQ